MDRDSELGIIRAAYARADPGRRGDVVDARLEAALGTTRREEFLGPGPWPILRSSRDYVPTPDADPATSTPTISWASARTALNNGQPSLHAYLIQPASPAAGEHVVHIGTGTGYYTAILAHLAGPSGRVTGIEYEPGLAARAKANWRPTRMSKVVAGDGAPGFFR